MGSFGLDTSASFLRLLPKYSQIIVGLSREEITHSTTLHRLRVLKKFYPHLLIGVRKDFHAKYAVFKLPRSIKVIVGSANMTNSPAIETSILSEDQKLYDLIVREHNHWFLASTTIEPDATVRLTRDALRALASAPVGR